jgi:hypothetical protein
LLEQYMAIADLDVSTRESYEGYIRRTIVADLSQAAAAEGPRPGPRQLLRAAAAVQRPGLHR